LISVSSSSSKTSTVGSLNDFVNNFLSRESNNDGSTKIFENRATNNVNETK